MKLLIQHLRGFAPCTNCGSLPVNPEFYWCTNFGGGTYGRHIHHDTTHNRFLWDGECWVLNLLGGREQPVVAVYSTRSGEDPQEATVIDAGGHYGECYFGLARGPP